MATWVEVPKDIGWLEGWRDFLNFFKNCILMEAEKRAVYGAKIGQPPHQRACTGRISSGGRL